MNGRGMVPPTLLTTMSRRPKAALAWSASAATASTPRGLHLRRDLLELLLGAGGQEHVGPRLGQRDGGRGTDAAARTCDDRHTVVESKSVQDRHAGGILPWTDDPGGQVPSQGHPRGIPD
jgi:hypothetical protein